MRIGLFGAGKMGTALACGLTNAFREIELRVVEPNDSAWEAFKKAVGERATLDRVGAEASWIDEVEVIILSVKPQQINAVLREIGKLRTDKLVISVAAGIRLSAVESALGDRARCVRVMPNTPLLIGEGFSAYALSCRCLKSDETFVTTLFNSPPRIAAGIGSKAVRVEEHLMDAITALSGSGPAYVFHFIHALIEGGKKLGLEEALARDAAMWTVAGALAMMRGQPQRSPIDLAGDVKSPNGTTEAAYRFLEQHQWEEILIRAMKAAEMRSRELSGEGK
jgi:pyrroline-5-carboxylate reductase